MSFRRWACAAILVSLCATRAGSGNKVSVTIRNGGTDEIGAMVFWGPSEQDSRVAVVPSGATPPGTIVDFNNLDDGAHKQVVAFTKGLPPALNDDVTSDSVTIDYPAPYEVKVKFWILCASPHCDTLPPNKKGKLAGFLVWANERLTAERAGFTLVRSGDDWISDQTGAGGNPGNFWLSFRANDCEHDDGNHSEFDNRVASIRTEGVINIYVVRTVEDADGKLDERNGMTCDWSHDSAVVGRSAIWGTMLHEIGHIFSLLHTDEEPWSDAIGGDKNFMNSYSSSRRYFTEGQVFWMHFSAASGFNHELRGVLPSVMPPNRRARDCQNPKPDAPPCPPVQTMLWNDH